jgi:hypothetical protein
MTIAVGTTGAGSPCVIPAAVLFGKGAIELRRQRRTGRAAITPPVNKERELLSPIWGSGVSITLAGPEGNLTRRLLRLANLKFWARR